MRCVLCNRKAIHGDDVCASCYQNVKRTRIARAIRDNSGAIIGSQPSADTRRNPRDGTLEDGIAQGSQRSTLERTP